MKRINITLALLLVATMAAAASAQDLPSNPDGSKLIRRVESRFNFTWDQRVQARAILQQEQPVLQQLHTQLAAEHAEMAQMPSYTDSQARAIAVKYAGTNADAMVEREKLRAELLAILTPAQREKLTRFRARFSSALDDRLLTLGDNL